MGRAGQRVTDMNIHPDGHFCSVPCVVLKILWRHFNRVDWNIAAQRI